VKPRKIGVTGVSYGGGISYLLAALKDRVERPNGTFIPWRSPQGKPMRIAAALPLWGWSDLSNALQPNGNTLDYLVHNPYGDRIGVEKQSYQSLLYGLGLSSGFYAPIGVDPSADITGWFNRINLGEPYDDALSHDLLTQIEKFHSPYYLQSGLPRRRQERPAPILAYNSWLDDLFPADETLRYRNLVKSQFRSAKFRVLFAAGPGHPRAPLSGTTPDLANFSSQFFTHYLKRGPAPQLHVRTYTQACGGSTMLGPFDSTTWAGQHPGEVRLDSAAPQTFTGAGGNPAISADVDPTPASLAHQGCVTEPSTPEPNTANYNLPAATGNGYTLLGSPTVIAKLAVSSANAQVAARLWDVAPGGTESFIARGVLRPEAGTNVAVFQLHPNGWHFTAGHVARLQLLGRDAPYARPSNGTFSITASNLELRLPVHEHPGGQVLKPLRPLNRDGQPAHLFELARR
ncbi:MAG TPA: CocE/NonD family hydrolase C-terminal non-catalytic domain-containing protein, partial [Solirubrobacterales bacterium]